MLLEGSDLNARGLLLCALLALYLLLWIGGVGQHFLIGQTPAEQNWVAPRFLLLAALIVLIKTDSRADVVQLLVIALAGLIRLKP